MEVRVLLSVAVKFLDDSSYQMILDGIEAKDAELAFRGAHTLKGVWL